MAIYESQSYNHYQQIFLIISDKTHHSNSLYLFTLYLQTEESTGISTTYTELIITVKRMGAALVKQGIQPGDVITILLENLITMDHILLFYSAARIGAVCHAPKPDLSAGVCSNSPELYITFVSRCVQ